MEEKGVFVCVYVCAVVTRLDPGDDRGKDFQASQLVETDIHDYMIC